jgi:precorrin-8X/cobalt-precorrin-8 methylmutase
LIERKRLKVKLSFPDELEKRARSRGMSEKSLGIEERSMNIIESEVGSHDYNTDQWHIVRRVIHATADFDFAKTGKIIFSKDAIEWAFQAFSEKGMILTDVEMVLSGINKRSLEKIGVKAVCNISDERVILESKNSNKTRSAVAMRNAISMIDNGIIAIGNAPTALLEVINMIRDASARPALIIGLPVGFVSAADSKAELMRTNIEYVTNLGRKGGSSAVSSIVNAMMLLYIEKFELK